MNNNSLCESWFPVTAGWPALSGFIDAIERFVARGGDPIAFWADTYKKTEPEMAAILGCDAVTYRHHVLNFLNDKCRRSPLTHTHILNFCRESGLHPVHLGSRDGDSQSSYAPEIFQAIRCVSQYAKNPEDRALAAWGVALEERRFAAFMEQGQEDEQRQHEISYFPAMLAAAHEFGSLEQRHSDVLTQCGEIKGDTVRGMLLKSFGRKNQKGSNERVDFSYINPVTYLDDAHISGAQRLAAVHAELAEKRKMVKRQQKDVAQTVEYAYGKNEAAAILHSLKYWALQYRATGFSKDAVVKNVQQILEKCHPLSDDREQAIRTLLPHTAQALEKFHQGLAEGLVAFAYHEEDLISATGKNQQEVSDFNRFTHWLETLDEPENRHIYNMFCNYAVSPQIRSLVPVADLEYGQ